MRPIEVHTCDQRMRRKECRKLINDLRFPADIGIQTTGTLAGLQHIPHGNPGLLQTRNALNVRRLRYIKIQQMPHDRPKPVLRMCVVLTGVE